MVDLLNRHVEVAVTPDPGFTLFFDRFAGTEELGRPFRYEVDLVSTSVGKARLLSLVGSKMTLKVKLQDGTSYRYFNGIVTRAVYLGQGSGYERYRFELRPKLWLLTQEVRCRIFQAKKLTEVIEAVLSEAGLSGEMEQSIVGASALPVQDFVVQYRESTFDFLSRLMEEVGVYYYHKHSDGLHKLVLTDDSSGHHPLPGDAATLKYFEMDGTYRRTQDHVWDWQATANISPGAYKQTDYNFTTPTADLKSALTNAPEHSSFSSYEVHDYPGSYATKAEGDKVSAIRMQELAASRVIAQGEGNVRVLTTGATFTLSQFSDETQNVSQLVTGASYFLTVREHGAGVEGEDTFRTTFQAIPADTPFRPRRLTRRPVIQGPQTAKVVGPAGEEIHCDEYGRVKLRFHWDRDTTVQDQDASCWIRVSQPWAGLSYGGMIIPRIGQEVIVEFLEGDPDRPIITGRVYNETQKVPYALPAEKTKSTWKSQSTPNATGFNELRFEDKAGSEEVFLQAQKDMNVLVVKGSRTTTIQEVDDTLTVTKGKRTVTIEGDHAVTINTGNQANTVKTGNQTVKVDKGNQSTTIGLGNHELKVTAGTSTTQAGHSIELKVGGNSIKIDMMSITLTCGANSIKLDASGIAVAGVPQTKVSGAAMVEVSGAIVKIN